MGISDSKIRFADGLARTQTEALNALLNGLSGAAGTYLSEPALIASVALLGRSEAAPRIASMSPPAGQGVVHEAQTLQRRGTLTPNVPLEMAIDEVAKGASLVFSFGLSDGAGEVAQLETRLRFVTPEEMSKFKGSGFPERMATPDMAWQESAAFDATAVATYLEISQDKNPIHHDVAAAQAVGLAEPVVPGMLIAGVGEAACAALCADQQVQQMKWRFMAPVPIGARLRYGLQPRGTGTARLFALTSDNIIAAICEVGF